MPNWDWERIDGTRTLHQVITTSTPGELLVRESSCFSCPSCKEYDFENCLRTEELGPVVRVTVRRTSTTVPAARAETRTRAGQERHRNETAELAMEGSVIAVAKDERQELDFVLITKPLGGLSDPEQLQGKILKRVEGIPNRFSTTGGDSISFSAAIVRSPPLLVREEGDFFEIDDRELSALVSEFLF